MSSRSWRAPGRDELREACRVPHRSIVRPPVTITEELSAAMGGLRGTDAADRLCELCVELFAVDAAAVSLVFDGANSGTLGVSGSAARRYDEVQFTLGEGPCLTCVADRSAVLVPDLHGGATVRWPLYAPAMLGLGVQGVFVLPVVLAGEYVGALDLFRHDVGALDSDQLAGATAAAELAQLSLLDVLAADLQTAVREPGSSAWADMNALTRVEVSQATGMIVGQLDVTPATALVLLRAHAYATGTSATAVARQILDNRLRLEL